MLKHDGTVWGWGPNRNGELCDGTTEPRYRPVRMNGIANAVDVDIEENASATVLADGTVWRCGMNAYSEMAKKNEPESVKYTTPQQIPGITTAVAVRTGGAAMVRLKDGTLLGWGSGIFGGLGNGRVEGIFPKPAPPIGLGPVLEHFWASNSAYAIKADGMMDVGVLHRRRGRRQGMAAHAAALAADEARRLSGIYRRNSFSRCTAQIWILYSE